MTVGPTLSTVGYDVYSLDAYLKLIFVLSEQLSILFPNYGLHQGCTTCGLG